jgi:predicted nucleic acid-binding protein
VTTLVDTSIWIDHLRRSDLRLVALLESVSVLVHPFVIGEIALGQFRRRAAILDDLALLPAAPVATDDEFRTFVDRERLPGSGLGFVDAHLLVSTRLAAGARLWTRDRRLGAAAARLGLIAAP